MKREAILLYIFVKLIVEIFLWGTHLKEFLKNAYKQE